MSYVIAMPDLVQSAAEDLAGIRSSLAEAATNAAGPTTGIAAAAQDEVSVAIASLFGNAGHEFQALTAQAQAFHAQFVGLMSSGANAYLGTEANAAAALVPGQIQAEVQSISGAIAGAPAAAPRLLQGINAFGATVAAPYQALGSTTVTNLHIVENTIAAKPLPFVNQSILGQQSVAQTFLNGAAGFPTGAPANSQLAIQGATTFNPAGVLQQLFNGPIGTAQTITTSLQTAANEIKAGLPTLSAGFHGAFQSLLAGNPVNAYGDLNQALINALFPGFSGTQVALPPNSVGEFLVTPLGPLGALGPVLNLPGQMAQSFVNLLPPGSIPAHMAQNAANLISALTNFNTTLNVSDSLTTANLSFGVPIQLIFDTLGGPANALSALNSTGVAFAGAVQTGNASAAAAALLDAPAVIANGYLNGTTFISLPPTAFTLSLFGLDLPTTSAVTIPLGGILTPLSFPTATAVTEISGIPLTLTVDITGGTPIGGAIPGLVSIGAQLAHSITPIM